LPKQSSGACFRLGRQHSTVLLLRSQPVVVGEECFLRRGELKLSHPISNGIVQKWEDMGHIWDYVFNQELQVPLNRAVL